MSEHLLTKMMTVHDDQRRYRLLYEVTGGFELPGDNAENDDVFVQIIASQVQEALCCDHCISVSPI